MRVQVNEMAGYKPPELPRGRSQLEIKEANLNDSGDSIVLNIEIIDGQPLPDGGDARGQQFMEFVTVDMSKTQDHKDGGAFARRRLDTCGKCFGFSPVDFDTDDLVGLKGWAILKPKADANGVLRVKVSEFLPS